MKYKALVCDFDGTLIKYGKTNYPSTKVINALQKASEVVYLSIATGRPMFNMSYVIDDLPVNAPCIINGGSQIYDPKTKKMIKSFPMETNDLKKLSNFVNKYYGRLYLNDGHKDYLVTNNIPTLVFSGVIPRLTAFQADHIIAFSSYIPTIALHKVPYWEKGFFEVTINHVTATKQHGISEIAKRLQIKPNEIISVGDSYNDFPLLMASGLKVAMGNAFEDLKSIADYIAPTVENDGVADVIERFILQKKLD